MTSTYWQKQIDAPLYPDIMWSRPESAAGAGKLAVIGGDSHGFGAPGIAWNVANSSGVGVCKVLLPDAVKKVVKGILPDADFAPSTPSGSFSKKALDELLSIASWSDATLLAGDIGRNSETAIALEQFVKHEIETIIDDMMVTSQCLFGVLVLHGMKTKRDYHDTYTGERISSEGDYRIGTDLDGRNTANILSLTVEKLNSIKEGRGDDERILAGHKLTAFVEKGSNYVFG